MTVPTRSVWKRHENFARPRRRSVRLRRSIHGKFAQTRLERKRPRLQALATGTVALQSVVKTPHLPRNFLFQRGHVGLRRQSGFLRFQPDGQRDFARDGADILEHRIESAVFVFDEGANSLRTSAAAVNIESITRQAPEAITPRPTPER